jgi:Na+-translocating ferredoxin:NAD+ oxidoreductase subunit B
MQDLVARIHHALPQTQCTRCDYPDCLSYAQAIATGEADINQCPPGGAEGVARLASITQQVALPLNDNNGIEGPVTVAIIDEAWCIGCTLCIKACPVDAIVGTNKAMHTVIESACTGCELCIPACPVDCISLDSVSGERTGWQAWSQAQADTALARYTARQARLKQEEAEHNERLEAKAKHKLADLGAASQHTDTAVLDSKRAVIEAALARAAAKRAAQHS